MYCTLIVTFRCYHHDHSLTYVLCTFVSLIWVPLTLKLCICNTCCIRITKTLLVQKADTVAHIIRMIFALTVFVQKGNTLTVLILKADAMARIIRTTFALTLWVLKKFALTFCVCKTHTAFRRQMP